MGKKFVLVLGPTGGLWPFIWGAGMEIKDQLESRGLVFKACGGDSGGAMASALIACGADPYDFFDKNAKYTKVGAIGGNPITWVKNCLNFVMHGGAIYSNNAYKDGIKPAWESLGLPKVPCYAYAWNLSTESGAIFPLHEMNEDGWAKGVCASMALPAALSPFAWNNSDLLAQCPEVVTDQLKIDEKYWEADSYFADGGISSYLPVDIVLDCDELLHKIEQVNGEWRTDWNEPDLPITIAVSLDDFQSPKFRQDIKDMNPFKKIIYACMGALRSSVHEDITDLVESGLEGYVLKAAPENMSKYGLKFDVTAKEMKEMFEAGRESVKEQIQEIIENQIFLEETPSLDE